MAQKHQSTTKDSLSSPNALTDDIYSGVGVLKSNWYSGRGKLRGCNYGTAFMISKRIIMTCSHNIFSDVMRRNADQLEFVFGVKEGKMAEGVYHSTKTIIIKKYGQGGSFKLLPVKEELCLILLESDSQTQCSPLSLASLLSSSGQNKERRMVNSNLGKDLKIVGYPCTYQNTPFMKDVTLQRQQLQGRLINIDNYIIYHNAPTRVGQSGSPILVENGQGGYSVIGIHTHSGGYGSLSNSGLYFNQQILQRVKTLVKEFNSERRLNQKVSIKEILRGDKSQDRLTEFGNQVVWTDDLELSQEDYEGSVMDASDYQELFYKEIVALNIDQEW